MVMLDIQYLTHCNGLFNINHPNLCELLSIVSTFGNVFLNVH